jgi:DNA-binding NarL/FixJ family response regulator
VLQLLAEGKSTKEIAALLNLSVKTIETHRLNIMEKLDLRSVAELTKYAIRHGLTSLQ